MIKKQFIFSNNQKGFTLIELLVVIAIVGVLTAVTMPRLFGVLENAKVRVDESNVRVIQTAAQIFHIENGDWPAAGVLNESYEGDFIDYLEEIPQDPWKNGGYYELLSNGNVEPLKGDTILN